MHRAVLVVLRREEPVAREIPLAEREVDWAAVTQKDFLPSYTRCHAVFARAPNRMRRRTMTGLSCVRSSDHGTTITSPVIPRLS